MDDYEIPFDGMSEEEFIYRIMNEEDPMYMGPRENTDADPDENWD